MVHNMIALEPELSIPSQFFKLYLSNFKARKKVVSQVKIYHKRLFDGVVKRGGKPPIRPVLTIMIRVASKQERIYVKWN